MKELFTWENFGRLCFGVLVVGACWKISGAIIDLVDRDIEKMKSVFPNQTSTPDDLVSAYKGMSKYYETQIEELNNTVKVLNDKLEKARTLPELVQPVRIIVEIEQRKTETEIKLQEMAKNYYISDDLMPGPTWEPPIGGLVIPERAITIEEYNRMKEAR